MENNYSSNTIKFTKSVKGTLIMEPEEKANIPFDRMLHFYRQFCDNSVKIKGTGEF